MVRKIISFITLCSFVIVTAGCGTMSPPNLKKTTTYHVADGKTTVMADGTEVKADTITVTEDKKQGSFLGSDNYDTYGDMFIHWVDVGISLVAAANSVECPSRAENAEARAYCQANKLNVVEHVSNREFKLPKPRTWQDNVNTALNAVVPLGTVFFMYKTVAWAARAAGQYHFDGTNSFVNSFNPNYQTAIGTTPTIFGTQAPYDPLFGRPPSDYFIPIQAAP